MKNSKKVPLVYAVSQIVFSPILEMKKYVGDMQEKFRHIGFSRYTQKDMMGIKFDVGGIVPDKKESWNFANKDNTINISLTTEAITIETSEYSSYENFSKDISNVLEVLQSTANPAFYERIGLRYVNLVRKTSEGFSHYLQNSILGFSTNDLSKNFASSQSVTSVKTEVGNLLLRCSVLNEGRFLSHDLSQDNIKFDVVLEKNEEVAILDIDHFSIKTKDFKKEDILNDLSDLRDFIKKSFNSCITSNAKKEWGV